LLAKKEVENKQLRRDAKRRRVDNEHAVSAVIHSVSPITRNEFALKVRLETLQGDGSPTP